MILRPVYRQLKWYSLILHGWNVHRYIYGLAHWSELRVKWPKSAWIYHRLNQAVCSIFANPPPPPPPKKAYWRDIPLSIFLMIGIPVMDSKYYCQPWKTSAPTRAPAKVWQYSVDTIDGRALWPSEQTIALRSDNISLAFCFLFSPISFAPYSLCTESCAAAPDDHATPPH